MKHEKIYEMVRQSDLGFLLGNNWMLHHEFEHLAKLISAHVSRELAKECAGFGEWTAVNIIESVRW